MRKVGRTNRISGGRIIHTCDLSPRTRIHVFYHTLCVSMTDCDHCFIINISNLLGHALTKRVDNPSERARGNKISRLDRNSAGGAPGPMGAPSAAPVGPGACPAEVRSRREIWLPRAHSEGPSTLLVSAWPSKFDTLTMKQ